MHLCRSQFGQTCKLVTSASASELAASHVLLPRIVRIGCVQKLIQNTYKYTNTKYKLYLSKNFAELLAPAASTRGVNIGIVEMCVRFSIFEKKYRKWRRPCGAIGETLFLFFSVQSVSHVCFAQTAIIPSCSPTKQKTSICFRH